MFDGLFGKKATKNVSKPALNIDNDTFLIRNGVLREYRGIKNTFIVPQGVTHIYNHELPIGDRFIDAIFIPRTVQRIGNCALPYCEAVYFEGTEQEWNSIMEYSGDENFQIGWKPAWCAKDSLYRVKEVHFYFNCHHPWTDDWEKNNK